MNGAPSYADFWAKLDQDDEGRIRSWHPLIAHSADVASVMEALLSKTILNERIASLVGWETLTSVHVARLSALAAIHDSGKVNHGFQNKAFSGKGPIEGHVSPIVEVLAGDDEYQEKLLLPLGVEDMLGWFSDPEGEGDALVPFLLATWGHHGKPVPPERNFKPDLWKANDKRDPVKGLKELGNSIRTWFPEAFEEGTEPFPNEPILQHAFNGLLTLADWIGSDERFFPFAEDLGDYMSIARSNAANSIENLSLDPSKARIQLKGITVEFEKLFGFEPYEVQQAVLDLPVHEEGALTVLESDTGSGKTEAAIARFSKLYQEGKVEGMYFALPTRSAASQIYERVVKAVERLFPEKEGRPPVVQAVSGYIKVDAVEGVPLPHFKVRWSDDKDDILRERGWAGEHPKRYLAGAIVVGTVDQVLMASLELKHAHMRAASLLRHFLVIDEVHASDTYMSHLLDQVLGLHLSAGGHALLMSATLGVAARYPLTERRGENMPHQQEARNAPYPLITHVNSERSVPEFRAARSSGKQKKLIPELKKLASSPEALVKLASKEARKGAKVLIIRNRVQDCVETQSALEKELEEDQELLFRVNGIRAPHHSRFSPDDRKRMDEAIEEGFGKDSMERSVIAVATQTVEQSLDIDADLLITDLCPMDVLLQRIGRLHRHERERPEGMEIARCVVLTPEDDDMGNAIHHSGKGSKGKHGLGTVYQDLRVLEATKRVLEDPDLKKWEIPFHNRELVERATHPDTLSGIVEEKGGNWEEHQRYLFGAEFADKQLADLVNLDFSQPFGDHGFNEDLDKVKTRLGRDDYQVFLPYELEGPFGERVKELSIQEWQFAETPEGNDIPEEKLRKDADSFSFDIGGRSFRYDRFGLSRVE